MQQSRKQKTAYGVIFIILIGFLLFAILSSRDSKTSPQSGTSRIRESAPESAPSTSDPDSSTQAESTPATSPAPTASSTAAASGQALVNSGPGQTVTVFMATVLAGTAVAHVQQRRTALK